MKYIQTGLLLLFITACSSSYAPSEKMLSLKKDMTVEQAVSIVQMAIWNPQGEKGICGSRGFWFDEESKMQVFEDKISMLGHKRGKQLKKIDNGFNGVIVFEKQYYPFDFEFNKIRYINIYNDPLLLPVFPDCNKQQKAEKYRIIDLFADDLYNIKFIVAVSEFDKVMAALSLLMPESDIYIK